MAYLGAFDARYRKAIISDWQKLCKEQKIPCSNEFSLTNILGDQVGSDRLSCQCSITVLSIGPDTSMADSWTTKGLLLSGQWGDSEQCQEVGSDDRSPGPGSQVDQKYGERK